MMCVGACGRVLGLGADVKGEYGEMVATLEAPEHRRAWIESFPHLEYLTLPCSCPVPSTRSEAIASLKGRGCRVVCSHYATVYHEGGSCP